jgi:hypothetical protein
LLVAWIHRSMLWALLPHDDFTTRTLLVTAATGSLRRKASLLNGGDGRADQRITLAVPVTACTWCMCERRRG